jgi:hypothetical protein
VPTGPLAKRIGTSRFCLCAQPGALKQAQRFSNPLGTLAAAYVPENLAEKIRALPLRFWRLAGLCGFAGFWGSTTSGCAAGKILVGNREYIVFSE